MLAGRIAIITGAGRGIGAAAALAFGREGARVVINDLDADEAHASAAAVRAAGGEAIAFPGSVTDANLPDALMRATLDAYGTPDVIVNNAGFLWDGVLHNMSDRQFEEVIACHLTAPFRLLRAAAPHMRGSAKAELAAGRRPRDRSIINAGITGLTKTLAKEWGPLGVRANAIAFGMIETRMTSAFAEEAAVTVGGEAIPQGLPEHVAKIWSSAETLKAVVPLARKGTVEEAAAGMLFLASPLASYITGHTLEVTGGFGI
eukprot:jgi/Chrpa1/7469/Chrysochromulina_OHIO_Genome00001374-RA